MIDMVLNKPQPAGIANERVSSGSTCMERGRTEDGRGTVMSEIGESGIFVHRCRVVRIRSHCPEKDTHLEGTHNKLTRRWGSLPSWWGLWFKLDDGLGNGHAWSPTA